MGSAEATTAALPTALVSKPAGAVSSPRRLRVGIISIAGTRFAMDVTQLREVILYPGPIALVPGASFWLTGVTNRHGRIMAVFDLQVCLAGTTTALGATARVLVVEHETHLYGFAVVGLDTVDDPECVKRRSTKPSRPNLLILVPGNRCVCV